MSPFPSSRRFQQRLPTELLSSLASSLVEGRIFEIVSMLQEVQNSTERQLFQQRLQKQRAFQEEKLNFQKEKEDGTGGAKSEESVVLSMSGPAFIKWSENDPALVQDRHVIPGLFFLLSFSGASCSASALQDRHREALAQFDREVVTQLDGKVSEQQAMLESAGVAGTDGAAGERGVSGGDADEHWN